jgi:hypothetical protein
MALKEIGLSVKSTVVPANNVDLLWFGTRLMFINCVALQYYPLCGLVVTLPGCRLRGSGSIPGATRFSE